jgi:PAS domain-containing protein
MTSNKSINMPDYTETTPGPWPVRRSRQLWRKLLPAAVLVAAITFDRTGWLSFSLVPLTCVLALIIFAFLLPSRQLIGWTIIYILAIAATLWMKRGAWSGGSGNPEALVATRALMAAAAGVLACLLARRREQDVLISGEINRILDQMEIPVVTSDQDGWLVHINPQASRLLGSNKLIGSSFFQHFPVASEKGKLIKSYVDLATGVTAGPIAIQLASSGDNSLIYSAIMLRVDIGARRHVMTLLYPHTVASPTTPTLRND